jgi:hypothetical protein
MAFSAQPPDLHRLSLGRESFAAVGPLALLDSASYPIPVRRLADSLPASFSGPLTVATLRFAWVATTNSPGDSHPLVIVHAGHTGGIPECLPALGAFFLPTRKQLSGPLIRQTLTWCPGPQGEVLST